MLCNASFASSMFGGSAFSQRLPAPALAAIAASGWLISWATAELDHVVAPITRQTLALVQEGLGCDVRIESRYRQGRQQEQQRQDAGVIAGHVWLSRCGAVALTLPGAKSAAAMPA